jgi:hypothetical protein
MKTTPEKMIAGNIYFISIKKVPGFLNTIKKADTATANNTKKYKKF